MGILFLLSCLLIPLITGAVAGGDSSSSLDINIIVPESFADIFESPDILDLQENDLRTSRLVSALKAKAKGSQEHVMELLRSLGIPETQITQAWIANEIFVKNVSISEVSSLRKKMPESYVILRPPRIHSIHFDSTEDGVNFQESRRQSAAQWGVEKIGAPEAWQVTRGEGIVVASIGTGIFLEHESLFDGFAGFWIDPVYNSPTPTDPNGFDTHMLGTAVGRSNGIGVAPAAQWIACRALTAAGSGSTADIITCAQSMLEADPKPNVILNGWGGSSFPALDNILKAWKATGIFAIFPVGGGGPSCGSVGDPASSPDVIALVSTNSNDAIGGVSGRGPAPQGRVKPDFAAPGVSTLSAGITGPDSYVVLSTSGSSAGAHTAGAIALIKSFNSSLSYDEVIELLKDNAVKPPLTDNDRTCSETEWPNMAYGYGRVDVKFLGM